MNSQTDPKVTSQKKSPVFLFILSGLLLLFLLLFFSIRYYEVARKFPDNTVTQNVVETIRVFIPFSQPAQDPKTSQSSGKTDIPFNAYSGTYTLSQDINGEFASDTMTDTVKSIISVEVTDELSFSGNFDESTYTKSSYNPEIVTSQATFPFSGKLSTDTVVTIPMKYKKTIDSTTVKPYHREYEMTANMKLSLQDTMTLKITLEILNNGKVKSTTDYLLTKKQ